MDRPVAQHSGKLIWSGEHWINAIRPEGGEEPTAWVSLFHTRYSPAGEGNTAQVMIAGEAGFSIICSDNRELGDWTTEQFLSKGGYYDPAAQIVEASFQRQGDVRRDPAWLIETPEHRVVARWQVTEQPIIADGTFRSGTEHFTLLFFTDEASVEMDGQPINGTPYQRDIWKPSIGGDRSSCVFALAETLVEFSS